MNKFINYQQSNVNRINTKISENLEKFMQSLDSYCAMLNPLLQKFAEANQGGKRIRGVLVLLSYQLFGGKNVEDVFDIASAVEIWQTAVLAQDDIIDNSLTRRGKPSLPNELGNNLAMCVGDLGMGHIANDIILNSNFDNETKIKVLKCFNDTYNRDTMLGQMVDIKLSENHIVTLEDIMKMYQLKTANYTVIGPMQMGAILAGASKENLVLIKNFGTEVGVMFQLVDDLLGVFGDEEKIGKPTTSDIKEGKKTPLSLYAFENASTEDLKELQRIYGVADHEITNKDVDLVREIFRKSGALQYVLELIDKYKGNAKKFIEKFPSNEFKDILRDFIEYMSKIPEYITIMSSEHNIQEFIPIGTIIPRILPGDSNKEI